MSGLSSVLSGLDGVRFWQEDFYRDLHRHPELSHREHDTAAKVAEQLGRPADHIRLTWQPQAPIRTPECCRTGGDRHRFQYLPIRHATEVIDVRSHGRPPTPDQAFHLDELLARLRALGRRGPVARPIVLAAGDLRLDRPAGGAGAGRSRSS